MEKGNVIGRVRQADEDVPADWRHSKGASEPRPADGTRAGRPHARRSQAKDQDRKQRRQRRERSARPSVPCRLVLHSWPEMSLPGRREQRAQTTAPDLNTDGSCIPWRYHSGMSKQIAVRLSDDLVDFVDSIVATGEQRSRAAVVSRALERERRRTIAARDAEILAALGPDADLASLADHVVDVPVDLA
jgi:Arc/MetJ-type ribon-helix-helix transcriptional regulator